MKRKLDSRWALIRENETDLIFVDENEIIYPKRINADKGNLVFFLVFKIMLDFYWLSLLIGQYENSWFKINLIHSYSDTAIYRIISAIMWSICPG